MEQVSNAELMEMMDIVSSSPELRERVSRRIQNNRECKKAYNARAYKEKKVKQEKREKAMKLFQETTKHIERNREEEIKNYRKQRWGW